MVMYRNLKLLVEIRRRMFHRTSDSEEQEFWDVVSVWPEHQGRNGGAEWWNVRITRRELFENISEARDDIFPDDARRQQRVLINAAFQWHCPACVCTAADRACQKENCKTYLRLFFERISWELAEYYPRRRSWEQPCHTLGVAQL